jgi:hypothetical protein
LVGALDDVPGKLVDRVAYEHASSIAHLNSQLT